MKSVGINRLIKLQANIENIRNICILAHVDHGKTTLADFLLASNGIISKKMAGKLRYMDSRKDEQERGITMKSSAISLYYERGKEEFLVNLIDSPGHVDFSSEVSTAVRLCDGAIIVVDAVEGVCPQTKSVLYQAWQENITPVLVLNKIDRLITELKFTPLEAHLHLQQILEQVNAITSELFTVDVMRKTEETDETIESNNHSDTVKDLCHWSSGLEETDDSHIYFSPDRGNVIFGSALDGWAFGIDHFAEIYSEKLGIQKDILCKTLWGDYYFSSKTKTIKEGAQAKGKKSLFAQFILGNIWAVYEAFFIKRDSEMIEKISKSLNIKIDERTAKSNDFKNHLSNFCYQWLPLEKAVLDMVVTILPSPKHINEEKAEKLLSKSSQGFDSIPEASRSLKQALIACDSSEIAPLIIYISKMFAVPKKSLPRFMKKPLTQEEILLRKHLARQNYAERKKIEAEQVDANKVLASNGIPLNLSTDESDNLEDDVFIAFAKIFSGVIRRGQKIYVLGPKHNPEKALQEEKAGIKIDPSLKVKDLSNENHITWATIDELYMFMGRELISLDQVPAGNVLGIGGLEEHVLKSATLSNTLACPSFCGLNFVAEPIVRIAVEPKLMNEMGKLIKGMKLLNQADPCVQMFVQETGEHVLVTLGEVHLQRCLDDLKERFAKIDVIASAPIVPFRETIVYCGKDSSIENENEKYPTSKQKLKDTTEETIECKTANKQWYFHIKATPLPDSVIKLLEKNVELIKVLHHHSSLRPWDKNCVDKKINPEIVVALKEFKHLLSKSFLEAGEDWCDIVDHIWSFGPRHYGPNVLINKIKDYQRSSVWHCIEDAPFEKRTLRDFDNSVVTGFQLATLSGPLCEEPMMGVAFSIYSWSSVVKPDNSFVLKEIQVPSKSESIVFKSSDSKNSENKENGNKQDSDQYGPLSGQVISAIKDGCRQAFQVQSQRLMIAMYVCIIQTTAEVLGKIYAVISKRNGRVLNEDLQVGSQVFKITAVLPVIESFGFAEEIRKRTSGLANPQLVFSHWEVISIDPFWVPSTEEEYEHFGDKADCENRALKYMNDIRRRKGLTIEEKVVERAEKQRTLTKNK